MNKPLAFSLFGACVAAIIFFTIQMVKQEPSHEAIDPIAVKVLQVANPVQTLAQAEQLPPTSVEAAPADLQSVDVTQLPTRLSLWPSPSIDSLKVEYPGHERAIAHITRSVKFDTFASLSAADATRLIGYAQALSDTSSEPILHLCWGHDSAPLVVEAFEAVRALAVVEGALIGPPQEAFQADSRWNRTATDGSNIAIGTPVTLTWSFVPDGTLVPSGRRDANNNDILVPNNLVEKLNEAYGAPTVANDLTTAPWFQFFEDAFDTWANVTSNIYIYEPGANDGIPGDDGASFPDINGGVLGVRGDVRIAGVPNDGDSGVLGFNYTPDAGDMVIDSEDSSNLSSGQEALFKNMIAHEHGHGLGLSHVCPIDRSKLMEPLISLSFAGPQIDDILTVQGVYGDPLERQGNHKNNDTIATARDLGALNSGFSADNISISNSADRDIFKLQVNSARQLNITATPTSAGTYLEGPQFPSGCSVGTSFDPRTRQDLIIRVIGPDGTSVVGTSNTATIGQPEMLNNIQLLQTGQNYYIEISGGGENSGSNNNTQLYSLNLELIDPSAVQLSNFTITSESCTPGNGVPDPGEIISASVDISNIGTATATNIDVALSGSAALTVVGATNQSILSLPPGASTSLTYTFSLSGTCLNRETITLRADSDTSFVELSQELTLGTIEVVSVQDFDSTGTGQVPAGYAQTSGRSDADWEVVASSLSSAPNSVATQNAQFGSNAAILVSPTFNEITRFSILEFDHRYTLEAGINAGVLEISINNGAWVDWLTAGGTFEQNGYNRTTFSGVTLNGVPTVNPIGGDRSAWSGQSDGSVKTIAQFPPLAAGQATRVRWFMGSLAGNDTGSNPGWFIDDITLRGPVCCEQTIPIVSVTAPNPVISELTPSTSADFVITSDTTPSSDIAVAYTLSGDAVAGSDFVALAGSATILSGQAMVAIPVNAIIDSEVEGDETLTITISPSVNYGVMTAAASITIKDLPFDEYRFNNFGNSTSNIGDAEDFDFDGIANLVEYAFRLDPTTAAPLPFSLLVEDTGGSTLELTYYEDTQLDDVTYIVETSATLAPNSWVTTGVTITNGATTNGLQTRTATIAISDSQPGFIRIRIERIVP
jgi:hypothetical protein